MGEARFNGADSDEPLNSGDLSLDSENGEESVDGGLIAEFDPKGPDGKQIIDTDQKFGKEGASSQYNAPTSVELAWLKNAADLYKSSSFKLKVCPHSKLQYWLD